MIDTEKAVGTAAVGGLVTWFVTRLVTSPDKVRDLADRVTKLEEAVGPNGLRAVIAEWRQETRELREAVADLREAVAGMRGRA